MEKRPSAASSLVLALLVAGLGAAAFPPTAASALGSSCTQQSNPYSVTGASWGTPGSPLSVYPGDQDVPLTVTMLFYGPCTSAQSSFVLNFAQGYNVLPFTATDGNPQTPQNVELNIAPDTLVTQTFYLDVNQNAPTGVTYNIPMSIQYSNGTAAYVTTELTTVPIALEGPVQLTFVASTSHLIAGAQNNVTITVTNSGTAASGPVSLAVSVPSGVTVLNQLATTAALAAGGSASETLDLFVPSSLSGNALSLTLTGKYLDAYSNTQTVTQTLGFQVTTQGSQSGASFIVQGAQWGASSGAAAPLPGTQDATLVVNLQYLGSEPVTSLQGTVQLPSGMTDLNGGGTAVAYSSATTSQYGAVALTFYLDIASTVSPGSYNYTLTLDWMTSQSSGLTETATLMPPPIAQLQSSFQVEGAAWQGASSPAGGAATAVSPVPGAQNIALVVSLQYLGTAPIASLKGTLSLPAGVTDINGHGTATAFAATATANQVVTLTFGLDVATTVKPGSYNFTLGLSWTTANSVTLNQTATVSPPPVVSGTSTSFPLSVTQRNSTVTAGSQTAAGFTLANVGTATIYSPTFSLAVDPPLVIASIGPTVPAAQVAPGANATFTARLTSSPSATPGIYSGTLTVAFTDSSGASHTQSFPVSFTLEGTIILILQNEVVSQSLTGFTVTGSILDEGTASAYYVSVSGLIGARTATPVYLGEIDPNTPLPFSVTIPFPAPAAVNATAGANASTTASRSFSRSFNASRIGNFTFPGGNFSVPGGFAGLFGNGSRLSSGSGTVDIAISLTFKDTFGTDRVQAFTVPATVLPASLLSTGLTTGRGSAASSGDRALTYLAYGVVAAVAATLVVGGFMARRYRARRLAAIPPDQRGEQSVI